MVQKDDSLKEKCAVCAVYFPKSQASFLVYRGLFALQHRGQEASGISASNGKIITHAGEGLVTQVYKQLDIEKLQGKLAIGHNRYATVGGSKAHAQPIATKKNLVSLAHNGTLPQTQKLEMFLKEKNLSVKNLNDSEMMQRVLEYYLERGNSIENAIKKSYPLFTGAFALVILTKDAIVGVRDSCGIRPLSIGKLAGKGYVFSSETVGLDNVGAKFLRDVKPGEMVVAGKRGLHSYQLTKGQEKLDIFEIVYFARPESQFYGKSVNAMRREMGKQLAKEKKINADMVIGVPNSAIPAAAGYAEESGIPYEADALLKNSYIHRTFIDPSLEGKREDGVRRKFSAIPAIVKGKRIILVEDSVVRGPSLKVLVHMMRSSGAREVHAVISCPPVMYPDFYGIATPTQKELIAAKKTIEEIRDYVEADSLYYLSFSGMLKAIDIPKEKLCTSCFTGEYPIDIGDNAKNIDFIVGAS